LLGLLSSKAGKILDCKEYMLECIESREEKNLSSLPVLYGKFLLSDLQKGQGLTVANTLRRILYSEISAVGITSVKLRPQGYFHEFSTFPFLKESLGEILFNLRSIIFKTSFPYSSAQLGILNFHASVTKLSSINEIDSAENHKKRNDSSLQILRAKDFQFPPGIEVVFPDQYIATVTQKKDFAFALECKIQKISSRESIQTGIDKPTEILRSSTALTQSIQELEPSFAGDDASKTGSAEEHEAGENILQKRNLFPIHGTVFPIKKINYTIEHDSFENELVFFEIWTNGSVSPQDVFQQGIKKSLQLFQKFQ
jgi:DNA-directed RNA polymerase subunit alpha